jgi:hypothetical protein
MTFEAKRAAIIAALTTAGVNEVLKKKDAVPKKYPAAMVVWAGEDGDQAVSGRYVSTKIKFDIYLIVSMKGADPDLAMYNLKESFRTEFQTRLHSDFKEVKCWNGMASGTKPVKIAQLVEKD